MTPFDGELPPSRCSSPTRLPTSRWETPRPAANDVGEAIVAGLRAVQTRVETTVTRVVRRHRQGRCPSRMVETTWFADLAVPLQVGDLTPRSTVTETLSTVDVALRTGRLARWLRVPRYPDGGYGYWLGRTAGDESRPPLPLNL